ncbi:RNA polymerase sigma factor RpoD/SigA [Candidatus Riflebacteria bacterium]
MKCWEHFEENPEDSKKYYCNLKVACEGCHYKRGWEYGIINETQFDRHEYLDPDKYGDLDEGMEIPQQGKIKVKTNPYRCFNMTNCTNMDCTVRKKGIIRCWEHWDGMTPENIMKYRGHSFDCTYCHYYRGWQMGLLHEGFFKSEYEKEKRIKKIVKQIQVEKFLGEYLNKIENAEKLTREDEKQLALRIAGGDKNAAKIILDANLTLVVNISRKFLGMGMGFLELFQEGSFGLLKALGKFDATLGNRFSTYATFWIRQSILSALSTRNRVIHIPYKILVMANKITRTIETQKRLGNEANLDNVAKILNMEEEDILEIIHLTRLPISIEQQEEEREEGIPRINLFLSSDRRPEDQLFDNEKKESLNKALKVLTNREREVIRYHFGLETNEPMNLAEVGRQLSISRERARQLLNQGLEKLKEGYFVNELRDFLH